jgi:hypothetical protein
MILDRAVDRRTGREHSSKTLPRQTRLADENFIIHGHLAFGAQFISC